MIILTALISFLMVAAQTQQPSLIETLRQKSADECVSLDYEFTYTVSGVRTVGGGTVEIQGNAYHMLGNGMEIFCDGTSTWMIDHAAFEVIIEAADSKEAGYMANPVTLLMNLENIASSYSVDANKVTLILPDDSSVEIIVNSITSCGTKKSENFCPPTKFDADWIVTDLR